MSAQAIGGWGIVALVILTFLRVPLGAAMGLVGLVGYAALDGWSKATVGWAPLPIRWRNTRCPCCRCSS